jgi:PHP family Zn ribbon phosphoesterase
LTMLSWFSADLHIHTVLSPCAELDMGPVNIVKAARELKIDIIGITDHNAAGNVVAVRDRAGKEGPVVIPGMEVQTREEVHLLSFFPEVKQLQAFAAYIRERLPPVRNRPEIFGDQVVVNGGERILYFEEILLVNSVTASLGEVVKEVLARDGLVIPAHVDRGAYSILANLGFIPPALPVAALEIARPEKLPDLLLCYPAVGQYPFVSFSDAHTLSQLKGRFRTYFYLKQPNFTEIKKALQGEGGRKVVIRQGPGSD